MSLRRIEPAPNGYYAFLFLFWFLLPNFQIMFKRKNKIGVAVLQVLISTNVYHQFRQRQKNPFQFPQSPIIHEKYQTEKQKLFFSKKIKKKEMNGVFQPQQHQRALHRRCWRLQERGLWIQDFAKEFPPPSLVCFCVNNLKLNIFQTKALFIMAGAKCPGVKGCSQILKPNHEWIDAWSLMVVKNKEI